VVYFLGEESAITPPGIEQPDGEGYFYPGLHNFVQNLPTLLSTIKRRNDDVFDVRYLGLIDYEGYDEQGNHILIARHIFEIDLTPIDPLLPLAVGTLEQDSNSEIWTVPEDVVNALIAIANRILWTPPTGPNIYGIFAINIAFQVDFGNNVILDGIGIVLGPPAHGGSGSGGGMSRPTGG
jgi:hypothetical protein